MFCRQLNSNEQIVQYISRLLDWQFQKLPRVVRDL